MKHGQKYRDALKKYDPAQVYALPKAVSLMKEMKFSKFDETVEVHVSLKLGKNQSVRDTVVLPHQFKGEKKVLVFCKDDRAQEALAAGAAYAGADEYIEKVKGGWLEFDIAVATPDMMKDVGRLVWSSAQGLDAQPEDRHRHERHRRRDQRAQEGADRVPRRQDRRHPPRGGKVSMDEQKTPRTSRLSSSRWRARSRPTRRPTSSGPSPSAPRWARYLGRL
jgi:hypothetical protein